MKDMIFLGLHTVLCYQNWNLHSQSLFCLQYLRQLKCVKISKVLFELSGLHSHPHSPTGSHHSVVATPVPAGAVLSRPQEVLAPPVVWMLIEHPVALRHMAGADVMAVKALVHAGAVVSQVRAVTHHVRPVVQPHPVRAVVL